VGDNDSRVRSTAVEWLTDQAALAKIAAEDKNSNVRELAKYRLQRLREANDAKSLR